MGCSTSKLDGLPAVALCRDRCNSLEETLLRSYALSDAHTTYLHSLTTIGPSIHRFFDQAVEYPLVVDSESDKLSESSSSDHSVASSDSNLPPKFDSDTEENEGTYCLPKLESQFSEHESDFYSQSYNSGTVTPPPPPPPSNYAWEFMSLFESYEFPYTTDAKNLKDRESTHCDKDEELKKKKVPMSRNKEKNSKMSEKKKKKDRKSDQQVSLDFSEVTKQLQEMFKKASEAGDNVSKMFDTSRFRYYPKHSVSQASSNTKMTTTDSKSTEDFGSDFSNISSTLKRLFLWEKKLYQEVKAEEKLRTSYIKNYKYLRTLEQKSTDRSKIEATRSSVQCLSTRMRVSIHKINNICVMINELRDEELWPQTKQLIHRLFEMWSSMLECHSRQYRVIVEAKKFDKMAMKGKLEISQLELAIELKLELRNWSQSLSKWIESQVMYVNALNGWLMRCLKQEPQEPTRDLSEEPPLFGVVNKWSQAFERSGGEKEFVEAVYTMLMHVNRQVEKQRMELEEERNVNGVVKDIERKLGMVEKEEQKMQREMKIMPSVRLSGSLNLKFNMEEIFKSMETLARNLKQAYEKLDLMCK